MQVLKDDIKKRIIQVSRQLFRKKGFRDTTTREIADAADITLSNLYHYFKSKDELFQYLLQPVIDTLEDMLYEYHGEEGDDVTSMTDEGYVERAVNDYLHLISGHKSGLKLLLFKAQGSSLENYKEHYVNMSTKQVVNWFHDMQRKHPELEMDISEIFIHLNAVWMFTLMEEILMHDLSEDDTKKVISEYVKFQVIGWRKMFKL